MSNTAYAQGTVLAARYRLERKLGAGGQGEVWQAHDDTRGTDIALKILDPAHAQDPGAWASLQQEYQITHRLDHPHVLAVYPPERIEALAVLPMELAPGGDLRRLCGKGYLEVVPSLIEVALALEHAHDRGVIHRDLKPGNVLFDGRGHVKLADFGIAQLRARPAGSAPGDATAEGRSPSTDAVGSPFSASPEQLRGEAPQPSDDIYGMGALIYELLSGYPPHYPHFDPLKIRSEPVPPLQCATPVPSVLTQLVTRMLDKDPTHRPSGMREVIEELDAALQETLTCGFDLLEHEDLTEGAAAGSPSSHSSHPAADSAHRNPDERTSRAAASSLHPGGERTQELPNATWHGSRAGRLQRDRDSLQDTRPLRRVQPASLGAATASAASAAAASSGTASSATANAAAAGSAAASAATGTAASSSAAAAKAAKAVPGGEAAGKAAASKAAAASAATASAARGEAATGTSGGGVSLITTFLARVPRGPRAPRPPLPKKGATLPPRSAPAAPDGHAGTVSGAPAFTGKTPSATSPGSSGAGALPPVPPPATPAAEDPWAEEIRQERLARANSPFGSGNTGRWLIALACAAALLLALVLTRPRPPAPTQTPASAAPSPSQRSLPAGLAPLLEARFKESRASLERRRASLEERGAAQWGGADYASARAFLAEATAAHDAGNLSLAQERLSKAAQRIDQVEQLAGVALATAMTAGERALAAGQQELALQSFALARRIDPSDPRLAVQERRARDLNGVLPLLASARNAENTHNFTRARQEYSRVLALDPGNPAAEQGIARATAAADDERFEKVLGRGFTALAAGRLREAREAFKKARILRPGAAEPTEGLKRVAAAAATRGYTTARTKAESLEAQGRWEDALQAYESALQQDPSLVFAKEGRERAAAHLNIGVTVEVNSGAHTLSTPASSGPAALSSSSSGSGPSAAAALVQRIQVYLDHPERLLVSAGRGEASALLNQVSVVAESRGDAKADARAGTRATTRNGAASRPDPRAADLRQQGQRLQTLLESLDSPVHVSMVSDGETDLTITEIGSLDSGSLGSFGRRDIDLKPGRYQVRGTRAGYRDVRRDVTVAPGEENATINVSCTEPLPPT